MTTMHSLVPPHPGIVGAVLTLGGKNASGTVMMETILYGTLMGIPVVLVGWFGPGRWWARSQFVGTPEADTAKEDTVVMTGPAPQPPAFAAAVLVVTLPLVLSLFGFGAKLLVDLGHLPAALSQPLADPETVPAWLAFLKHKPIDWLQFVGHPTMALLVPTGLAFWLLGWRRGLGTNHWES